MRSFHSSIINIAEGSISRPPGGKNFEKLFQCSSVLRPAPFCGRSLRYVLPYPSHRHSVTGNDRIMMSLSSFQKKLSREVVKKGCLCNINVWRRKSGNSMEGFYSHLSCISRIFRPECSFDRQEAMNPCIQASDFSPPCPGAQGRGNGFCRFSKKYDNKTKTRIPSLAA